MFVTEHVKLEDWSKVSLKSLRKVSLYQDIGSQIDIPSWKDERPKTIGLIVDILVKLLASPSNADSILKSYYSCEEKTIIKAIISDSTLIDSYLFEVLATLVSKRSRKRAIVTFSSSDIEKINLLCSQTVSMFNSQVGTRYYCECEYKYINPRSGKHLVSSGVPDLVTDSILYEFKVSPHTEIFDLWILQSLIYYCLILISKMDLTLYGGVVFPERYFNWLSTHDIKTIKILNFMGGTVFSIPLSKVSRGILEYVMLYSTGFSLSEVYESISASAELAGQSLISKTKQLEEVITGYDLETKYLT